MIPVGSDPRGLASSPSGDLIYVPNRFSDDVSVIATSSNTVIAVVTDPSFDEPYYVAFTPDGSEAWVVNKKGSGSGDGSVTIINTSSHTVDGTIVDSCFASPEAIATNPVTNRAYVMNKSGDNVCVVDTSTRMVVADVDVGSGSEPRGAVVTPDGAYVYVSGVANNTVSKIRTSDNTVVQTISGGFTYPRGMDITPSGDKIYVAQCYAYGNGNDGKGHISVIERSDPNNDTVSHIPLGDEYDYLCDLVLVPELDRLYVTDESDDEVEVIDTSNDTEVTGTDYPISLGDNSPRFIVVQGNERSVGAVSARVPTLPTWAMVTLMTLMGLIVMVSLERGKSPT